MDYKNGKIYCIYNYVNSEVYVGSTCSSLSKRMSEHRNNARTSAKMRHYALYESMREHGFDTHCIELYELYPCETKMELHRREGEVIREIGTLNKRIEGRSKEEFYNDNYDRINHKKKAIDEDDKIYKILYQHIHNPRL